MTDQSTSELLRTFARHALQEDARGNVVVRDQWRVNWIEAGGLITWENERPVYRCADGSRTGNVWTAIESWAPTPKRPKQEEDDE
jgi:hypothetical protein